ncbi:hypothetical protein QP185_22475 [Sphingomonas aerolata]|uniref:hypothetical protein n=1 Tax=Sphingomonas aerolata TaxID=185951 RepID=UPI002FE1AB6C
MDDAPRPVTVEQFTEAMLESGRLHTDIGWVLARTRTGEQPTWLTGFDEDRPVWTASIDEAAVYDRDGAELKGGDALTRPTTMTFFMPSAI